MSTPKKSPKMDLGLRKLSLIEQENVHGGAGIVKKPKPGGISGSPDLNSCMCVCAPRPL